MYWLHAASARRKTSSILDVSTMSILSKPLLLELADHLDAHGIAWTVQEGNDQIDVHDDGDVLIISCIADRFIVEPWHHNFYGSMFTFRTSEGPRALRKIHSWLRRSRGEDNLTQCIKETAVVNWKFEGF